MKKMVSTRQILSLASVAVFALVVACSPNNVTSDDSLKKYFDEQQVTGTFGLYDNGSGQFTIYNLARFKDSAYLPASTFKIVNALVGLETGKIVNDQMVIPWDGHVRSYPMGDTATGWNKDLTMAEAFKASAVPYFQEVARRIGADTMQHWLDTLNYGSKKIKTAIDTFWLDNSLKITADEEMGLVKKLYFGQLPFQKRSQDIVKNLMMQEDNANYKLAYKSGLGFLENGKAFGWVIGWIEENRHPYFFALNIEGAAGKDFPAKRLAIVKAILKENAFFLGKR